MALEVRGRTDAAVLVPLYLEGDELHAVFTKRREDMRRHAGEISFPGGRYDEGESDLRATALREAEEEIGLPRTEVRLLGELPATSTFATNYVIHPFVGVIPEGLALRPNPSEVASILLFRLEELRAGFALRRLVRRGLPIRTPTYVIGEHLIWGATARILGELLDRLGS